MNKNRKIKRGLTTSLAVGMSVMMGAVPVFAAGTSSDADAVYKEETVYVNADATGTSDEVTVSNWLKNLGSLPRTWARVSGPILAAQPAVFVICVR